MAPLLRWPFALALALCWQLILARVLFTNDEYNIVAQQPFTLTWEGNSGPVTITLMNGPDADLQEVQVVGCKQINTKSASSSVY
jgi:hypothetical protein